LAKSKAESKPKRGSLFPGLPDLVSFRRSPRG
jgi:hypothetical protein